MENIDKDALWSAYDILGPAWFALRVIAMAAFSVVAIASQAAACYVLGHHVDQRYIQGRTSYSRHFWEGMGSIALGSVCALVSVGAIFSAQEYLF